LNWTFLVCLAIEVLLLVLLLAFATFQPTLCFVVLLASNIAAILLQISVLLLLASMITLLLLLLLRSRAGPPAWDDPMQHAAIKYSQPVAAWVHQPPILCH
jgi:hypothetical protein